jgi:hypothetical protein
MFHRLWIISLCLVLSVGNNADCQAPNPKDKSAPTELPQNYVRLFEKIESDRHSTISPIKAQLSEAEQDLQSARNGQIDPTRKNMLIQMLSPKVYVFPSEAVKKETIANMATRISALETQLEASRKRPGLTIDSPAFDSPPINVGDIGTADAILLQKKNNNEGLVTIKYSVPTTIIVGNTTYKKNELKEYVAHLRGVDLAVKIDGRPIDLPIIEIVGTHSYATVAGGQKTVPLIQPVDMKKLNNAYQRWLEPIVKAEEIAQNQNDEATRRIRAETEKEQKAKTDAATIAAREQKATETLNAAKFNYENGNKEKAKAKLKTMIADFAGTKAATEAEELLKKWAM